MFDINEYKTDRDLEVEGVWVDFIDGAKIKVASADNPKYIQQVLKDSKTQVLSKSEGSFDADEKAAAKRMADSILIDWQYFFEGEKPLEYSKEKAAELLISVKPLVAAVNRASRDETLYRQKLHADIEKN